jgi:NAD(P)-dependent dehydrogenase (short-subunit alcohol dehydrogenase family)
LECYSNYWFAPVASIGMEDIVLTGASRGIGRALALALASPDRRLSLCARDAGALASLREEITARGGHADIHTANIGTLAGARTLGAHLAPSLVAGATLIHNAGLWPSARQLGPEGLEQAFVTNCVGPLLLQAPLLAAGRLRRVMVVGAGLMVKGRFDPARTPCGEDFSWWRTYASTKLAFAVATRDVARAHPEVDFLVIHPGVVRTDLGATGGPLGWLLALVKRRWESPDVCAARLCRVLEQPRWSKPGEARWMFEEAVQPWPEAAAQQATADAVRAATAPLLAG